MLPCGAFSVLPSFFTAERPAISASNNLFELRLSQKSGDQNDSNNNTDIDPEMEVVTKEMFLRDMLETEEVRIRKKGKKGGKEKEYRVMDNRDNLPFSVQLQTPDPYVHPEVKRKRAQKAKKKRHAVEEQISSRLYTDSGTGNGEDNTKTLLGDFSLDKHTTTGDVLLVGGHEYKVMRHRCQYKYAGGQRFVMVRKILEVKEVGRLFTENVLKKQFSQSCEEDIDSSEKL